VTGRPADDPPHPRRQPLRAAPGAAAPAPGVRRDVGVVIVAAGTGSRVGGAELKQLRWVAGKPMLLHSVQTFMARDDVACVVVVLPRQYAGDPPPWLFQCDVDRLLVAQGGRERGESVANGLEDLPPGRRSSSCTMRRGRS
jgi:2-C-methyl-D-erythritol 4-phosphate cytidylyltransferase